MTRTTFEEFDAAVLELTSGVNLVEAGAGTGKTYAIGMLVLRAIVELEIEIDRILIVTFTKAATEELRSRIRARLVEARDLLAAPGNIGEEGDRTLLTWREGVKNPAQAVTLLSQALLDYDQAPIFTIHGFCQRALTEQALESGQLFDAELLADVDNVLLEAVDDYWRAHIYALPLQLCGLLTARYPRPEDLLASVRAGVRKVMPVEPAGLDFSTTGERILALKRNIRDWWQENGEVLLPLFKESMAMSHFKKNVTENLPSWLEEMELLGRDEDAPLPSHLDWLVQQNLQDGLNGNKVRGAKKESYFDSWPLPESLAEDYGSALSDYVIALRVHFTKYLQKEIPSRLAKLGCMGFDDLIHNLAAAIKGKNGPLLCRQLGERYRVGLIDEFQDTDLDQYVIFSRLFGDDNHWLYLIGDPKQAIYGFRGADIHSYFIAQSEAERKLTLTRNYRSHPALVEEINRLFSASDNPFGYDAETLQYRTVSPAVNAEVRLLEKDGCIVSGMHYCALPPDGESKNGRWSSGKAAQWLLRYTAHEIVNLLNGSSYITDENGKRLLLPGDIAVLVRSNRQAEQCREMLAEAGVHAVLGSRQSVFSTGECQELLLLLRAIENPLDIGLVKGAMTIPWFGRTGTDLAEIWQDENLFSEWGNRFHSYRQLWNEVGFMTMFSRFLVEEEVLPNLAPVRFAERKITNIHHLAELVQEQETENRLGPFQILQWLSRTAEQNLGGQSSELLLESDSDAVKIVTMHMAKGLQYHVVFCPYLWYWRDSTGGGGEQVIVHEDNDLLVDLGSSEFNARIEDAVQEEAAENIRLLYVALTRAKTCCHVMWADVAGRRPVGDARKSSLGILLSVGGRDNSEEEIDYRSVLHNLAGDNAFLFYHDIDTDDPVLPVLGASEKPGLVPPGIVSRSLHTDWQMSSFSAMAGLSEYEYDSARSSGIAAPADGADKEIEAKNLPAGAGFGNAIHDLLEQFPFSTITSDNDDLLPTILMKCRRYGIESPPEDILRLLDCVTNTPLSSNRKEMPTLRLLADSKCLKEMPYYLRFDALLTSEISRLLSDDPAVAPLNARNMQGYLTGFIDLVFEHNGKYFLCDYKTNLLGEKMQSYCQDALVNAMQAHNYGLQYWLYTLVLNRYLRVRLPNYSYQNDFGGVMYLFLRGMSPEIPGSGVYFTRPDYDVLTALDELMGGQ